MPNTITPVDEAAAIFNRIFESLARASGKTLKPTTRADIARACELLTQAAGHYDLLDDLLDTVPPKPRTSRSTVVLARDQADSADDDVGYQTWRQRRRYTAEQGGE